jgi:hypothetical protein
MKLISVLKKVIQKSHADELKVSSAVKEVKLFFITIQYDNHGKFAKNSEAIIFYWNQLLRKTCCGTKKETLFSFIF